MVKVEIKTVKCDLCGEIKEGIEVSKPVLWIFKMRVRLCQSCVARTFRKFRKGV